MAKSSVSLPVLYTKRKNEFDIVVKKLKDAREIISDTVVNQMIVACFSRKLADYNIDDKKDYNKVIDIVSTWRYNVGAMKDVPAIQLRLEADYLFKTWPNTTIEDVRVCIELMTQDVLDLKLEYVNFSALFMGRVLTAYYNYKSTVIGKVHDLIDQQLPASEERTLAQRAEDIKGLVKLCHDHYLEKFKETIFNGVVYDFLRNTRRLVITKELAEKAKAESSVLYSKMRDNNNRSIAQLLRPTQASKDDKKKALRQFGVIYCLKDYFGKIKIDELLASITEKDIEIITEK